MDGKSRDPNDEPATDLLKLVPICQTPKGVSQQLNRHTLDLLNSRIRLPATLRYIFGELLHNETQCIC